MNELRNYDDCTKQIKEIINGKIYYMSHGISIHAKIISRLIAKFVNYLDSNHKECEVYTELDHYLDTDNEKYYVEPDISIICDDSKFNLKGYKGSPELVIEVLSPSTRGRDRGDKFKLYEKAEVKEYWIVEPKLKSIEQYVLENGVYNLKTTVFLLDEIEFDLLTEEEKQNYDSTISPCMFDDLVIDLNKIFFKSDLDL